MVAGKPCTDPTHERREVYWSGRNVTVCVTCKRTKQAEWNEANKGRVKLTQANWYEANKDTVRVYREANKDRISLVQAERRASLRETVFSHYGGRCACCGLSVSSLLTVDHVVAIGGAAAGTRPGTHAVYRSVINSGFSDEYQVLCQGCNSAKGGHRTACPHRVEPAAPTDSAAKSMRKLKAEAVQAYGGRCFCCGETNVHLLGLDHVNNDGAEHRRTLNLKGNGGGVFFYRHLRKNGWPTDPPLRTACGTCNYGTRLESGCPCGGVEDRERRVALGLVPAVS